MWVPSLGHEDPWRRAWQLTPVFMPGESHEQRSLDMTEVIGMPAYSFDSPVSTGLWLCSRHNPKAWELISKQKHKFYTLRACREAWGKTRAQSSHQHLTLLSQRCPRSHQMLTVDAQRKDDPRYQAIPRFPNKQIRKQAWYWLTYTEV